MEDMFKNKIVDLDEYRWITIDDCSKKIGTSIRTIYQYLKDGKIRGIKWNGRRLIDTISVIGFMLEEKCLEIEQIKNEEVKKSFTTYNQ